MASWKAQNIWQSNWTWTVKVIFKKTSWKTYWEFQTQAAVAYFWSQEGSFHIYQNNIIDWVRCGTYIYPGRYHCANKTFRQHISIKNWLKRLTRTIQAYSLLAGPMSIVMLRFISLLPISRPISKSVTHFSWICKGLLWYECCGIRNNPCCVKISFIYYELCLKCLWLTSLKIKINTKIWLCDILITHLLSEAVYFLRIFCYFVYSYQPGNINIRPGLRVFKDGSLWDQSYLLLVVKLISLLISLQDCPIRNQDEAMYRWNRDWDCFCVRRPVFRRWASSDVFEHNSCMKSYAHRGSEWSCRRLYMNIWEIIISDSL